MGNRNVTKALKNQLVKHAIEPALARALESNNSPVINHGIAPVTNIFLL